MEWMTLNSIREWMYFSINSARSIEYPYGQNKFGLLPYTMQKNQFQIDHRSKCEL